MATAHTRRARGWLVSMERLAKEITADRMQQQLVLRIMDENLRVYSVIIRRLDLTLVDDYRLNFLPKIARSQLPLFII